MVVDKPASTRMSRLAVMLTLPLNVSLLAMTACFFTRAAAAAPAFALFERAAGAAPPREDIPADIRTKALSGKTARTSI